MAKGSQLTQIEWGTLSYFKNNIFSHDECFREYPLIEPRILLKLYNEKLIFIEPTYENNWKDTKIGITEKGLKVLTDG